MSNKIFGVILSAYIEGLRLTIANSADRASHGDVSCFAPCYDYDFANISLQFSAPGSSLVDQHGKAESNHEVHLIVVVAVILTDCSYM